MRGVYGKYFYGNEISEYGQEHGFVDYGTLAKAFDAVLNNDILSATEGIGYWEEESGFIDNSDEIAELEERAAELEDIEDATEDTAAELEAIREEIAELEDEQDRQPEIFQYYIVSESGAEILRECNEIVFYNEALDMYLWGVTHYGTAWSYVLTDIRCNLGLDAVLETETETETETESDGILDRVAATVAKVGKGVEDAITGQNATKTANA